MADINYSVFFAISAISVCSASVIKLVTTDLRAKLLLIPCVRKIEDYRLLIPIRIIYQSNNIKLTQRFLQLNNQIK